MSTAAGGSGAAHDATVWAGGPASGPTDYVAQLEREVALIEEKLAGTKDALAAKKEELKQARAEAKE